MFADTIIICMLTAMVVLCSGVPIEFIFSSKVVKTFMLVYALVAIVGDTIDLGLVWSISDTFNGLMVIPNLIDVFLLSGTVTKQVKEHLGDK